MKKIMTVRTTESCGECDFIKFDKGLGFFVCGEKDLFVDPCLDDDDEPIHKDCPLKEYPEEAYND